MNINNLILISIILVLIIGFGGFIFKKLKNKDIEITPQDFLKDFTALVISLAQTSMKILSEKSNNYQTEEDFKEALANIVAEDLYKELTTTEEISKFALLVPFEQYKEFVKQVFIISKDININKYFKKPKEEKIKIEEKVSKDLPKGKVSISKELDQIVKMK